MLSLLSDLLSVFETIGAYVATAVVEVINALFTAIEVAVEALFAVLPSMPITATFDPWWLQWLNWFYPLGAVIAIATTMLALYIAWLVVRYLLQLVRAS